MDGLQWKNPIKMDDLGGKPTIFGNTQLQQFHKKMFFGETSEKEQNSGLAKISPRK